MVNTGKPSGGCFACRKRRVKCDKQKPHCKRCITLGKPCPGYLDEWSSRCRIQNEWAEDKVQSRVKLKTREREQKNADSGSSRTTSPISPMAEDGLSDSRTQAGSPKQVEPYVGALSAPLRRSPFIGPETYTITHFYDDYVVKTGAPLLDFLPGLYSGPQTLSCLESVVPAVALANSAKQLNRPDLMQEARKYYGRAIISLNASLQIREEAISDGVLSTVFLLGLFELISAENVSPSSGDTSDRFPLALWNAHIVGGRTLLRLRGTRQLETHVGRNLFILMNYSSLINTFMLREEPSHQLYRWTDLPQSWIAAFALEDPIYQAAKICAEIRQILLSETTQGLSQEELTALLRRGMNIGSALSHADGQLPERWPSELMSAEHMNAFSHLGDLWGDVTEVIARNQYRAMRVQVFQSLSELLHNAPETARTDLAHQLNEWRATITILVELICEDAWALLGAPGHGVAGIAIRAYLLLWPLSVAISADGISSSRKQWIRDRLRWIGETAGFGYASVIADMA